MRLLSPCLLILVAVCSSGCSMCATGYLEDYATVGGKWQRGDPAYGRVGSIFSDSGSTIAAGDIGQRVIDSHPAGIEGQVFGEATTEGYIEDFQADGEEFYPLESSSLPLESSDSIYEDAPQTDGVLMLGDEW